MPKKDSKKDSRFDRVVTGAKKGIHKSVMGISDAVFHGTNETVEDMKNKTIGSKVNKKIADTAVKATPKVIKGAEKVVVTAKKKIEDDRAYDHRFDKKEDYMAHLKKSKKK